MPRVKLAHRRPTLKTAIEWIAHEDNAGGCDSRYDIAGYISTVMAADLFGCNQHQLAERIAVERERAGLTVGDMTPEQTHEFNAALPPCGNLRARAGKIKIKKSL